MSARRQLEKQAYPSRLADGAEVKILCASASSQGDRPVTQKPRVVMTRGFCCYAVRWIRGSSRQSLLDRHALGEVARLVDVAAELQCDVIGEQLKRNDRQQRLDDLGCVGDRQEDLATAIRVDRSPSVPTAMIRPLRARTSSTIAERLGVQRALGCDEDARGCLRRPGRSGRASSQRSDSPRRGCS